MTYLSEIVFHNKFLNSIVKSFSQLFFSEKLTVGYLFIIFVGYLSYRALIFSIVAVVIGNVTSWLFFKHQRHILPMGGVGYNCTIIGFYLTPFILHYPALGLATLFLLSVVTTIITYFLRAFLYPFGMPVLTLGPVISIMLFYTIYFYCFHIDIRNVFNVLFNTHYLLSFYIGYMIMFLVTNYRVGFFVVLATLPIFLLSFFLKINMVYLIINIAIVVFASAGYFIPKHKLGWMASALCIIPCVALYWVEQWIYWRIGIPVLLLPAIFSIWMIYAFLFGKYYQLPIFSTLQQAAELLKSTYQLEKKNHCVNRCGYEHLIWHS